MQKQGRTQTVSLDLMIINLRLCMHAPLNISVRVLHIVVAICA